MPLPRTRGDFLLEKASDVFPVTASDGASKNRAVLLRLSLEFSDFCFKVGSGLSKWLLWGRAEDSSGKAECNIYGHCAMMLFCLASSPMINCTPFAQVCSQVVFYQGSGRGVYGVFY